MQPGGVAHMSVARFDQRLITATFKAAVELDPRDALERVDPGRLLNWVGIRYMPDWATPGGQPLVDDLVLWDMADRVASRAWAGSATLVLGDTPDDELGLIAPVELLDSYYVHLAYRVGPGCCALLHDYRASGDHADPRVAAATGTRLRGSSPPFTESGTSALCRSTDLGGAAGKQLAQAGHAGIFALFRADRERVESLLPWPLEPNDASDIVLMFANQTQTGINLFREDDHGLDVLARLSPHHITWHEVLFKLYCSYRGQRGMFFPFQYKDRDHSVALGLYDGLVTKLGRIDETYPMEGQPLNDVMAPGRIATLSVARHNERIITVRFEAERELPATQVMQRLDLTGEWTNIYGLRYFPDYTRPDHPPLVHDLIIWDMASAALARAWSGTVEVTFGSSDYEELYLLEPLELLESYFVYYEYQAGPGVCRQLHNYLDAPFATD
jgi:hypothetical protein